MRVRFAVVLSLLFYSCVIGVEPPAFDMPKSPQAVSAMAAHDAAMGKAEADYSAAKAVADKIYLDALKGALLKASAAKDASEVNALSQLIKTIEAQLADAPKASANTAPTQQAKKIVYLCDASGTMQSVFPTLRSSVNRSIGLLEANQSFNVVFFSGDTVTPFAKAGVVPATSESKESVADWMARISPKQGTNPFGAIQKAFSCSPDVINVYTDGFDQVDSANAITAEFAKLNSRKRVKVNCFLLSNDPTRNKSLVQSLEKIANDNGGTFEIVKAIESNQ